MLDQAQGGKTDQGAAQEGGLAAAADFARASGDAFFELGPDERFVSLIDPEGVLSGCGESILGRRLEDLGCVSVDPADGRRRAAAMAAAEAFRNLDVLHRVAGAVRRLSLSAQPFFDPEGTLLGWRGVARDVTGRHATSERERLSRQRLGDAIESLSSGFVLWDAEERLVLCNRTLREMFEVVGWRPLEGALMTEAFATAAAGGMARTAETTPEAWRDQMLALHRGVGGEWDVLGPEGRWRHVVTSRTSEGGVVGIWTDVTERRAMADQLLAASAAADKADHAKADFLAGMSHELRTPLHAVLGFNELLATQLESHINEAQRGYFRRIAEAGSILALLIDDVLDYARIDAGHLAIHPDVISAHDVADQAAGQLESFAERQGVALTLEPVDDVRLRADRGRLVQILSNLISNAVKYNRPDGHVWVRWQDQGAMVRIEVQDDGLGIPLEQQSKVFTAFERLGREYGSVSGTGLGLALCRRLAEAMGGDMNFVSAPDEGSIFWVDLPAARGEETSG